MIFFPFSPILSLDRIFYFVKLQVICIQGILPNLLGASSFSLSFVDYELYNPSYLDFGQTDNCHTNALIYTVISLNIKLNVNAFV